MGPFASAQGRCIKEKGRGAQGRAARRAHDIRGKEHGAQGAGHWGAGQKGLAPQLFVEYN